MAYGDRKTRRSRGGGGGYYNWDADARARSKGRLDEVKRQASPVKYLLSLTHGQLLELHRKTNSISRYGKYDWERIMALLDDRGVAALESRLEEAWQQEDKESKEQVKAREKNNEARKARMQEQQEQLVDESRLTAGYLHSELAAAIIRHDKHGLYEGDWLDDPVEAMITGAGFGEEVTKVAGIKLQVNICLDVSNSMYYNGLTDISTAAVRTMYLALHQAAEQLPPGSLIVNAWLWAGYDDGKYVEHLTDTSGWAYKEFTDDNPLGPMEGLPSARYQWSGEDTWIYPLLKALEDWENLHGDPGAYRLDLIISDGVLEHKTDASKGDVIQDRRDGNLQSVVLNFLPMSDWADYRVPNRCVQYPADADNLFGLLRQILGEWLTGV